MKGEYSVQPRVILLNKVVMTVIAGNMEQSHLFFNVAVLLYSIKQP